MVKISQPPPVSPTPTPIFQFPISFKYYILNQKLD